MSSFFTLHHVAAEKFFALPVDSTSMPILFQSDPGIFVSITSITTGICLVTCINFIDKTVGCVSSKQNFTSVLIHVSCLHRTTSVWTSGWKTFFLSLDSSCQYCSAYRCDRIIKKNVGKWHGHHLVRNLKLRGENRIEYIMGLGPVRTHCT